MLLADIDFKIGAVLKGQGLTPTVAFSDFPNKENERYYSTVCQKDNKPYFFKIRIAREKEVQKAILKEIKVSRTLNSLATSSLTIPCLISASTKSPEWILVEYVGAKTVGFMYDFFYSEQVLKKIARFLVMNLKSLHEIDVLGFQRQAEIECLVQNDGSWYLARVEKILSQVKAYLKINELKRILDFFQEGRKILDKTCHFLCHGDFSLANFMYFNNKLFLIDWESLYLNNFARDIAHLWVQSFKRPKFRDELLSFFCKEYQERSDVNLLLNLMMLYESLENLSWWNFEHKVKKSKVFSYHTKKALGARIADIKALIGQI